MLGLVEKKEQKHEEVKEYNESNCITLNNEESINSSGDSNSVKVKLKLFCIYFSDKQYLGSCLYEPDFVTGMENADVFLSEEAAEKELDKTPFYGYNHKIVPYYRQHKEFFEDDEFEIDVYKEA